MARFYPIYIRRSDGKLEVVNKGNRKEPNQPTQEQMDQRPDKNGVSDFYRECTSDEVKNVDWRRKLGGMLARELQWKEKAGTESGYILVSFPENYRLFEHIKKSEKDGKTEVKNKTHAAGGNDRQDAYLYGHPSGRRKRFRSPADYFPHLLWLCTDESGDPDNCSCKICCPEELENIVPGAKAVRQEKSIRLDEQRPVKVTSPQQIRASLKQESKSATPELRQVTQARPLSIDQQIDSQYGNFKYRQGELCWFRRGQAWGLGVILRRWDSQSVHSYSVQPLSYPNHKHGPVTLTSDEDLRPWLAWSVPRFTHPGLNDLSPLPQYETLNWSWLAQGRFGNGGDLDVDASILAAKSIDTSYTPINPIQQQEIQPGVVDTYYNGLYLGAEKIWKGEPVRIAPGTGLEILVMQYIIERVRQGMAEQIQLIGDIYTPTEVPHSDPNTPTPASPMNNPNLPQRLTKDIGYRNARSIQARQKATYWKLVSANTRVDVNNIKGRWYESTLWLPVLQPEAYGAMLGKGDVKELSFYMNARGDCLQANRDSSLPQVSRMNLRRTTRLEAFGQAVPSGTQVVDGTEPPQQTSVDPKLSATKSMPAGSRYASTSIPHNADGSGSIDQFMDLDSMGNHGGY